MTQHEKLNYVEFPAKDIPATKLFFQNAFGWSFEDFGPDYTAFTNQGLDGGFYKSDLVSTKNNGSALLVLLSDNLKNTQENVELAGGKITQAIFSFPGGSRFDIMEASGKELAVWCKISA